MRPAHWQRAHRARTTYARCYTVTDPKMQNDHPTKIDLVAAIEDSHMKTLVTVGGEYFGVEGIGKGGAGGSDGDVYFFKLTDLVKDRGAIRVSLFVSGASRACVPDFNARLETACLNALRRGFDSGDFSFDAKDQYRELKPKAVDFRPQKKASDLMIRRFIAVCAYHLWIEHSQNGLTPYVDFDYAEDCLLYTSRCV